MKKIFIRACLVALAAFGVSAYAADLPTSFKATTLNGTQVAVTPARLASFECVGGQVNTVRVDSAAFYYVDAGGALCTKLQTLPNFVKQPGVNRWWQVTYDSSQCYAGSTLMNYSTGIAVPNDGCQLDTLLKAKSN